ncbi:hypothetical protein ANN_18798, partial [Periplaneta americana]
MHLRILKDCKYKKERKGRKKERKKERKKKERKKKERKKKERKKERKKEEMPTVYKRKNDARGRWTEDDLKRAIDAVRENKMGVNEASRNFDIPSRTLRRRMTSSNYKKSLGPSACLGDEAENKLLTHIQKMQEVGFAPTRNDVKIMAFKMAQKLGIKHRFSVHKGQAGKDWFNSFMRRHPEISIRKAEGVSLNRAQGMSKDEVGKYFQLLEKILQEEDLLQKPSHIFNMDKTGLQLNNKPGYVVAKKGSKDVHLLTSAEKGETISVLACSSAEGYFLPPFCIFKGVNKKKEFEDGMPPGSTVVMAKKSAYVTSEIFMMWLREHFLPRKPAGKVLIILDGHSSHVSDIGILDFATANDIILLCLPSHTTHYLQPLDRYNLGIFWVKPGESCNHGNGMSGFRATGIFPFDPSAVPEHAFLLSGQAAGEGLNYNNRNENEASTSAKNMEVRSEGPPDLVGASSASGNPVDDNDDQNGGGMKVVTPRKILQEISPVPTLPQNQPKRKQSAAVLTSDENMAKKRLKFLEKGRIHKRSIAKVPISKRQHRTDSEDEDEPEPLIRDDEDE